MANFTPAGPAPQHHFLGLTINTLWGRAKVLRPAELSHTEMAAGHIQPGWWEVVVLPTKEQPDAVRRWVPEAWVWDGMVPPPILTPPCVAPIGRARELV